MTPEIQEAQLAAVAGCIEFLAREPKCKIAAHKLLIQLRREQLRFHLRLDPAQDGTAKPPERQERNECAAPSRTFPAWQDARDFLAFLFFVASTLVLFIVVAP